MLQQKDPNIPKQFLVEFNNYTIQKLQFLYKSLGYNTTVLEELLLNNKEEFVDELIDQLSQDKPNKNEQLLQLINKGQFNQLKMILKGKISIDQMHNQDLEDCEIKQFEQMENNNEENVEIKQVALIFELQEHILRQILSYLDPYQLQIFSQTCREFRQFYLSNCDKLYKKFCQSLFIVRQTNVPLVSPFEMIIPTINQNIYLYPHNTVVQINQDIREVVWGDVPEYHSIITKDAPLKYFGKQFKSYKQCFDFAPRIHFCGIYAIKEKYIKFGEAGLSHQFAPCHLVEYYRYIRFWPDGTVTMMISVKKLKRGDILHYFANEELPQQQPNDKICRGEYIQDNDKVIVKTFRGTSIFSFTYQIKSVQNSPSILLVVQDVNMKMIGDTYVNDLKNNSQSKYLAYKHIKEFRQGLQDISGLQWNQITY